MFDPFYLYSTTRPKSTKNAQILQKKPVDPHFAVTGADLKRAMAVMKSFNYYFSKSAPKYIAIPVSYNINSTTLSRIDIAFDTMFSNLHNYIRSLMESQYSDIFSSSFNGIQFFLILNSFQGYFTDQTTTLSSVNYYITNRFLFTRQYWDDATFHSATFSSIDNDLIDYCVIYTIDGSHASANYSRDTGSGDSLVPGALQAYTFPNNDDIYNYFKDTNPQVNPFSTSNQLGIYADSNDIRARRIIVQFTLNIFVTYFFFSFFFLF